MRLVSWNVNGLRAVVQKNFYEFFSQIDADIFAIQESKLQEGQIELDIPADYHQYWSYAEKKGYSGTAVFSKVEPLRTLHQLGVPELDAEGRVCALEFPDFWFVCVYTPNAQDGLARIDFRMAWEDAFRDFLCGLRDGTLPDGSSGQPKGVVVCGDMNVAHNEIDLKNPGPNRGNAGFSDEERGKFGELLEAGFVDTFRHFYPDLEGAYSWWSYRGGARARNAGWRIDYFLVTQDLLDKVEGAAIYSEVMGSDHCPVALNLDL